MDFTIRAAGDTTAKSSINQPAMPAIINNIIRSVKQIATQVVYGDLFNYLMAMLALMTKRMSESQPNEFKYQKVLTVFLMAQSTHTFQLPPLNNLLYKEAIASKPKSRLLPSEEDTSV